MKRLPPAKAAWLGQPIKGMLAPQALTTLGKLLNREMICKAMDVDPKKLVDVVAKLREGKLAGVGLSMPHKRSALSMGTPSGEARAIGAANCLKFEDGSVKAHNTEATGFYDVVSDASFKPKDARCQILGAGASARAAAYALGRAGARQVLVWARKDVEAQALAKEMATFWPDTIYTAGPAGPAELWVNCTPLGCQGFPDKPPVKALTGCMMAVDFSCEKTKFQAMATALRARVFDGRTILVCQTIRTWEFWFGPVGGPGRNVLKADVLRVRKWR